MPITFNFPWINYTYTPNNVKRIRKIIREFKPDVLHLHNHMFDLSFSAVQIKKETGLPLVVTLHTVIRHSSSIYNFFLLPLDRFFLKRTVLDHADQVFCPDANIKLYAEEIFKRKNAIIVPYGIDLGQVNEDSVEVIRKKHKLEGKRIILSLGHVHDIRNRKDLVLALPGIIKEIPNVVLVLIGAVSTEIPAQLAKKLGVKEHLILCGPIEHKDIPNFLQIADIEAHWLNQEEPERTSLGIASLESMAFGKTILAAANPDTYGKGILNDGENLIIVKPNNPEALSEIIVRLLQNDAERKRIGDNAQQTIKENFLWDSVCEQTIRVYNSVINSK